MNPLAAYKQASITTATRIDLLLALYDGAIERIAVAMNCLRDGQPSAAFEHIARAQLIVSGITTGIRTDIAPQLGVSILRLLEFVVYQLAQNNLDGLSAALNVMNNLREGFNTIRPEAIQLERSGQIPPVDANSAFQAIA
jgi:flagellar secretion chaperone FliS